MGLGRNQAVRAGNQDRAAAHRRLAAQCVALLTILTLLPPPAWAQRTQLKPGWNVFSPEQDVQIGRQVAADAERQLPVVRDPRIDGYLNRLGRRLAAKAQGVQFSTYEFRLVNDRSINAFALPGGQIFVHRGVVEAADNEAQLAGVIGHEIGHVSLRHGTNQATKASFTQGLLGILGGVVGGGSVGAIATQLGAGFAANSVLLKYSRDAERQSDIVGTQVLYDLGYDPRAMAQFFEKLEAESRGGRPPQFLSSHPNPDNRVEGVTAEIQRLGGAPENYRTDSAEFREFKQIVLALPAPPPKGARGTTRPGAGGTGGGRPAGRPEAPSRRFQTHNGGALQMSYPDNWQAYSQQGVPVTFAPEGGIVDDGRGNASVAYGVLVGIFQPRANSRGEITLSDATSQLLNELRQQNPEMRIEQRRTRIRIAGEPGLSVYFTNRSPISGVETGWVVTVLRNDGLYNFVCVAPENDFDNYDRTFQEMLSSVRFRR
jgi:Zn-dependent protease with chaperone function